MLVFSFDAVAAFSFLPVMSEPQTTLVEPVPEGRAHVARKPSGAFDAVADDVIDYEPTQSSETAATKQKRAATGRALVPAKSSAGAIVPYEARKVPALVGQLGDLEAYMRAAERAPLLSAEEERSLAQSLRDNDDVEAAQKLVLSHLRLVISIARGFLGYGLPYADLIQEGNIGLMKAIRHYDPDRGARLMTFAQHWIRSEIQEYIIRNWRIVKLATTKNQRKLFFNLRQLKNDSQAALTNQQAEEIAATLDVKPKEVLEMEERIYGQETSLDGPSDADDDDGFAPSDWLSREDDEPEAMLEKESRMRLEQEGLHKALKTLDERSRRVIEARYLFQDAGGTGKAATLQSLAKELGVSAERVRQIEKAAIVKLRQALVGEEMF